MSSRRNKKIIPQLDLGKVSTTGYKTSIRMASPLEENAFIQSIHEGPQIVSIPVPPYRHVFLVHVKPDGIWICDWNGKTHWRAIEHEPAWQQYRRVIQGIQSKFQRDLHYYPLDRVLKQKAVRQNKDHGGGGCSFYLFQWIPHADDLRGWTV